MILSAAIYKARLEKWGYQKNTSRHTVTAVLREKKQRESQGKESTFFFRGRPIDLEKVERFRDRARIQHTERPINLERVEGQRSLAQVNTSNGLQFHPAGLVSKTPPRSPLQRSLSTPRVWNIPEKLMYNIDIYIKGSFEHGDWSFNGNERLIESSQNQESEQTSVMSFLDGLDTGCRYFADGNADVGGLYWRRAFREIDSLVQGTYHGVLPNMIIMINELDDKNHREAATKLKSYAAQACIARQSPGHARTAIFKALADVDMDDMKELEIKIMTCFTQLFELYVGPRCYSTFVMQMDLARRRMLRGEAIDRCLPDLSVLDSTFGPINHRSLDVIRLRMEFLYRGKEYAEVKKYALLLIERAGTIEGDEWRRIYFLVKGGYHLGMAQYFTANYADAIRDLSRCLEWEEEMWKVDKTGQFNTEKIEMLERLENMALWKGQAAEAAGWCSQRMEAIEEVSEMDILL